MLRQLLLCLLLVIATKSFSQSFTSIWNTTLTGVSGNNEVTIPTNPAFTYNYTVDWGDGSQDTNVTGDITHAYATPGEYTISIDGTFPSIYFNNNGDRQKIIEILAWGNIVWRTMENAFYGCSNLNFDAIDSPDLSQVTSLKNMFRNASSFNGIVNNWITSTITDISGMFASANIFNRPLDNWNTINVTDMSETFSGASDFNEPLDNWNTASVTNMRFMFSAASDFNQNINNWDVSQVTDMSGMFRYTNSFNLPLNNWNVSNVANMSQMFEGSDFNLPLNNWNVSNVTNMSGMFSQYSDFNQNINNWDVSSVTDMSDMFLRATRFNQPLDNWDVSSVTDMSGMFDGYFATMIFNQPLNTWNVSNVTNMSTMFRDARAFNQPLDNWDVSNVTDMRQMFEDAEIFNQDISGWDVSNVTNMSGMFQEAEAFNIPLNTWNVGEVTDMSNMFFRAAIFDQPLNTWNIGKVTNMQNMFNLASSFNQDISGWDTSLVTNMTGVFNQASAFNQNLDSWNVGNVTNMNNMLSNSGISQENYDNILIGWAAQAVTSNVNLGATALTYCDGLSARQSLIDNYNWNITGDSVNCSYVLCTEITSPRDTDTQVPANSDIRWAPAPNATGYLVSIRRENGGTTQVIYDNQDFGNVVGIDFTNEFTPGDTVYVTVTPYNDDGPATGCPEISFTVVESWVNSPDAFKLTYDTTLQYLTFTTPPDQLKIETSPGLTYDYSIDWGDGQYDNNITADITHTYLTPGIYTVSIIGTFPAPRHEEFNSDSFKLLSIDQWGTQVWESMQGAFAGCENMEYNATDIPDLSNVTDMSRMFIVCRNFNGNINDWDVSNVTNMMGTFGVASIFNQPLNNWDVSNVTNLSLTFFRTDEFNQDISSWDTSSVTTMLRMFEDAKAFDQPLNSWDVSSVEDMQQMFQRTTVFNQPLNSWDVANVIDMESMFEQAGMFNQNIDSWDVSSVTNMSEMFRSAEAYNQPLNSWDVSSVIYTTGMFRGATLFNQPLNNWDVSSVNYMQSMFNSAEAFNQNIDSWNVTNVVNMSSMFNDAISYNQPLNSWDVNSVVNMSSMFRDAEVFNQPLNNWNVSAVANMTSMFEGALVFDQPIGTWNVSSVTLMGSMFEEAETFNRNIDSWDVAVVTNFDSMFKNAVLFNSPLNSWNTGEALTMAEMFSGATTFNQNVDSWNVSFVTTMEEMFKDASAFNQSLNSWNVASVSTMEGMFQNAVNFNGDISNWNVRGVTTMQNMFNGASSYNQSMNNWRITGVNNMNSMFENAIALNQSFDAWTPGTVTMRSMFEGASNFDQYLGDWVIENVTEMQNMLDDTNLSRVNYDNTLISWSDQSLSPGVILGANGLPYCEALEERQAIIDTYGWTINGDVLDCPIPVCTQLASPLNGATEVPVNTNITWEPVLYAKGYRVTVRVMPGNVLLVDNESVTDTFYEFGTDFLGGETVLVTLIPYNDTGDASSCLEESFEITANTIPTPPECTSLVFPISGSTDVSVSTNLEWQPISNANGYRLTIGTSSGGNDIADNLDVGNTTTYDFGSDLPEDTEIFVTLIPYNDEGDAATCTEESFTTEIIPVPPSCTNLSNPIDGTINVPIDTSISWNAVDDATGYLVIVGITQNGIEIANNIDVGNVTTYDFPNDLQENRTHYVTVIPYNAIGDASGCIEESFRTGNSTLNDPPSCTTLVTPSANSVDVPIETDLTWNATANTNGYRLTVGTTSGGNDILNNLDIGNVTTYDLSTDLPEGSTIYVTIEPYNDFGSAAPCTEESFTTESTATVPDCTSLANPINGTTGIAVDTDIAWNASVAATGYLLTVGTVTGGNDILDNVDVGNVTSYNFPSDLPDGSEIFVTIVPYNNEGGAVGCSEERFTTAMVSAIACTRMTEPLNGETSVSISTDISWEMEPIADGYFITIGTTSGGSDIANSVDVGNVVSYDIPNDLPLDTEIFVTIVPYDSVGSAIGCTEESFTTGLSPSPPGCTQLSNPLNGAIDVPISTDLTWDTVLEANGYYLTVGTTSGGNDIVDNLNVGNTTTFNLPTDLPENSEIFVQIVPYNDIGNASDCNEERFTTEVVATIPDCTSLVQPLDLAVDVMVDTNLSWNPVSNANGYRLTVGTTTGGTDIVNNLDVGSSTTYDFTNDLPENSEIFVMVIPYNELGNAVSCTEESFITGERPPMLPECTTLIAPQDGEMDVAINTAIEWQPVASATGYRITIGTSQGGTEIVDNIDLGDTTSYGASNLPYGQQIFIAITPYNDDGDSENCSLESFVTEEEPAAESLYGFSPDGDGINDYWEINGIENYPNNTVIIFNRWGDMVFKAEGYDNAANAFWGEANQLNGMGAGQLPEGTYFFQIIVPENHNLKSTQGYLVLKR